MQTFFSKVIRLLLVSLWVLSSLGITVAPAVTAPISSAATETAPGPRLWLRSGDFDPLAEEPDIPGPLHRTLALGQPGLHLVQFSGPIQDTWSAALQAAGLEVVTYLPDYAYLVWGNAAAVEKLRAATPLRWAGVYEPFYALHPALTALDDTTEVEVLVQVYTHPGAEQTVQTILDAALKVIRPPQKVLAYQNFGVRIAADRLAWLAGQPDVVNVEPRPVYQLLDEVQGQLMAGALNASGTQPSGPGYLAWLQGLGFSTNPADYPIVDVTDDGIDDGSATPLHPDFYVSGNMSNADRLSYNVNWTVDPAADGQAGHGNINASIVAGYNDQTGTAYEDANGYHYGLGLSPFGRVAGSKVFNNAGGWDLPGDNFTGLISQTYALGGRISTNSWGAGTSGDYTADDQAYDALVRDAQPGTGGNQEISIFFAAGNAGSGSGTTGSPGNAKNVVTVGAAENYRPTWTDGCGVAPSGADSAQDIASFSSRGPTDDTRVKPDLVAPGTHIQGAASQDPGYNGNGVCDQYHPTGQTLYAASSGTSHSTPAAAGAASLVYHYYEQNFGGQAPSPALLKAYMINATSYLTGTDASGNLPSNDQGYGAINLGTAFDGMPRIAIDQSETFAASGEDYELEGTVANSAQPFRVTLAWTDAPGPTIGNAYVNNLDLEVTIGGQTYKGNVFSGAASTTGGTADPRNNVESVFLPAGQSGVFTVHIAATNIAGDGVPGNADATDQDFALIIYNGMQESGVLDGTVHDGTLGSVLEGVSVQAITGTVAYAGETAAQGAYTLTVAPDTYTVSAWKYGYTLESVTGVSVTKDLTTTTDFTLTQTSLYTLTGCITDTITGDPLAATVAVVGPFGAPVTQTTTPQATGCYTLNLHGGPYTVTAESLLHQSGAAGMNLTADRVQNFSLTATTDDGILWGKVTSLETSNPVAGAAIQVTPGLTETQSAGDGSYELQLPHGTYTVTVSAPLYETQSETNVTVPQSNLTEHNYALGTSHLVLIPADGLGATLDLGSQATRTLTISNTGSGNLEFELAERTPGFTPLAHTGFSGGPDPYGYTYADSSEPDGPLFEWLDATDGTALGLSDDGESNVTLPFAFNFYGTAATDLRVGNNGGALFDTTSGDLSFNNVSLGTTTANNLIVPFWDDMSNEAGDVYYKTVGTAPDRRFVIEWHDLPHYGNVGNATFELILYEGTHNLKFQYQDLDFGNSSYDYGADATVGIRQAGSNYLQYSYNTAVLTDGLSICFQYPGSPPCDPQDIPWLSTDPLSGTVTAGNTLAVEVGFDASVSEVEQPGDYTAMLQITSNDPEAQPSVSYPVTMTVQPPATWGKLQGLVTSDRPGGSLESALVEVLSGTATVYSTTTASAGTYSRWLPSGAYTVAVSASGYISDQQSVTVSAGVTTTHDVELCRLAPEIAVTPAVLTTTQEMNSLVTRTLTISNTGSTDLNFEITEHTPGFTPASSLMKVTGVASPLTGGIRGGSDPYGYTYADSSAADGPLFEWLDATDGTALGLSDDGESNVTLPFAFNFYGTAATDLRVGNNGGALFNVTSGELGAYNSALGTASTDNFIVPFWDDMDDEAGDVYYKTIGAAPHRRFVVEWHDRPHYNNVGNATFELILYEGTHNLKFQYQDLDFGNSSYDYGASATVGIRQTGDNYLQYSHNTAVLTDGLSICFQYPGSPPCDPQDISWLSTDPLSGTVAAGNTLAVEVGFDSSVSEVDQPGDYTAMLQITSNDPEAQPAVSYPVTMTVETPATWGQLQGTITSDRPGGSLENALVEVLSGTATVYSTTTASAGTYSRWLPSGAYTVAVSASGYISDQQSVTVSAGVTTTHDVELCRLTPEIAVTPAVLTTTQEMNSLVTRTLTISNLGSANLEFNILELQGQVMASLSLPTPSVPLHTGPVEVSPALSAALEQTGKADFWVQMTEQADLNPAYAMDWRERGRFVYDTLREVAERSQAGVRAALDQAGVEYTPHWIINAIYVEGGDSATVNTLQQMAGVARILEHRVLPLPQPEEPSPFDTFSFEPLAPEWGLNIIQAPETWANYTSGEGIVVANIDTGVRYTHEALVAHYRGNLGASFDHDFNWYDPQGATAPADDQGHGSHTMGTMIGDDDNSNQTGVAPGATWIAADGCDATCPDTDLISSGEWLLAPCPIGVAPGDAQCDPDKRPHIVNNSWGDCDTDTNDFFETQIDAWRAAGIFTAFSNGNTGNCGYGSAFCDSMGNPARHYQVTSVGATDSSDNIASFSLWGPTDDSDPRLSEYANLKPEVSAPGASIRSSTNGSDSSYASWSGTSMAAPHVAGVAALILSANPGLIGQNDLIEDILKDTADPKVYSTGCGNEGPGNVPNNAFGWGRINALHAVEESRLLGDIAWASATPTSGTVSPGTATDVIVTFDATGLATGVYSGTLRIQHNDLYTSDINVPLTMTVLMPPPDFTLNKVASDEHVEIGLPFTYTLTVDNAGGDATGIIISDTLPTNTQFAWAGAGGALQGGAVVWNGLSHSGWSTFSVSYGVTVTCVASGTQIINDDYQVTATEWPTPTGGAPVIVTATVNIISGVAIAPATAALFGAPGETVTYTQHITNTGNYTDTFDLAPSGHSWATSAPTTVGPLAAGTGTAVQVTVAISATANNGDHDTVTLTATSQADASKEASSVLTTTAVIGCLDITGADFNFTPSAPQVGQVVTFTGNIAAGTLPITYTWNFNDGTTDNGQTIAHTFPLTTTAKTYTVTLTAANACPSQQVAHKPVTVQPRYIYLPLVLKQ